MREGTAFNPARLIEQERMKLPQQAEGSLFCQCEGKVDEEQQRRHPSNFQTNTLSGRPRDCSGRTWMSMYIVRCGYSEVVAQKEPVSADRELPIIIGAKQETHQTGLDMNELAVSENQEVVQR